MPGGHVGRPSRRAFNRMIGKIPDRIVWNRPGRLFKIQVAFHGLADLVGHGFVEDPPPTLQPVVQRLRQIDLGAHGHLLVPPRGLLMYIHYTSFLQRRDATCSASVVS